MTSASDETVMQAAAALRRIAVAAENSNHLGEIAALRAAAAPQLVAALQAILPYVCEAPDDVKAMAAEALAAARGERVLVFKRVA